MLSFLGVDRELWVPVGPPDASLRLWVMEPKKAAHAAPPRGTLVVLHGYRASVIWLKGMGRRFAEAGYRVVLVDLRGHGRSSGDYITYGVTESRGTTRVIDHLRVENLIVGKLGVWGISMGAATAIETAAIDPRIDAVVAVAPYTSMRAAVPRLMRLLLPVYGWMLTAEKIDRIVDAAGKEGGFDPGQANPLAAVQRVKAPVRIIHGTWDWVIPIVQGRQIRDAATGPHDMVEMDFTGHISAHFSGAVARKSIEWFDQNLAADERR